MKLFAQSSVVVAVAAILSSSCVCAGEYLPPFHYSDDWTLVSAPPPAGPYRPVNIDPRIPGAGTVEPMPVIPPQLREHRGTAEEPPAPASGTAAAQEASPAPEATAPVEMTAPEAAVEPAAPVELHTTGVVQAPEQTVAPETAPAAQETPAREASSASGQASGEPGFAAPAPGSTPVAGIPAPQARETTAAEGVPLNVPPPAAGPGMEYGRQSMERGMPSPPESQPAPRGYSRATPPPQMRHYPAPWYPYQPMYRGSQNTAPPPGYYTPQWRNDDQEVPPPPAYEGMYGRPPYPGPGNGW